MRPAIPAAADLPSGSIRIGEALTIWTRLPIGGSDLPDDLRPADALEVPGPVAGWQWTVENLDYALKSVPKEKLSLGIPLYGYHWFTGSPTVDKATGEEKPNLSANYIGAPNALQFANEFGGKVQWDEADHSAFFYFYRDQMREWIFFTDRRTFGDRYRLVADRKAFARVLLVGAGRGRPQDLVAASRPPLGWDWRWSAHSIPKLGCRFPTIAST